MSLLYEYDMVSSQLSSNQMISTVKCQLLSDTLPNSAQLNGTHRYRWLAILQIHIVVTYVLRDLVIFTVGTNTIHCHITPTDVTFCLFSQVDTYDIDMHINKYKKKYLLAKKKYLDLKEHLNLIGGADVYEISNEVLDNYRQITGIPNLYSIKEPTL